MFIRCSLIFPPTEYHEHALLPLLLGNERLIWSVAHVNASWNISKRAWVHEFAGLNTSATSCGHSGNYIVTSCTIHMYRFQNAKFTTLLLLWRMQGDEMGETYRTDDSEMCKILSGIYNFLLASSYSFRFYCLNICLRLQIVKHLVMNLIYRANKQMR
jgi:hypothetical protein